jgi:hypothetical protein
VLSDGRTRYVICVLDWCLLQTTAHELIVRRVATAAAIPATQVSVHTVHQHNAPIADLRAEQLLAASPTPPKHLDPEFMALVGERIAAAVQEACGRMEPLTHVGRGRARVERFASNRRVRLADGNVHVRYSATRDPVLQTAPEGLIDPWLRTVTLFNGERPIVRLHYYATHPMSYYGDGRATSDTVGLARRQLEQEEGVPQIYFTGCGGNITAGKYNDGSPAARVVLTGRIHDAMREAIADSQREPVTELSWKTVEVSVAGRTEIQWSEARARRQLADPKASPLDRLTAALDAAWDERLRRSHRLVLSRLQLGPVTLLHLPGEAFVEYQLYAQSLCPEDFIAVAAYGEAGPGYICCDATFNEGGYEPTMSRVGPPTEVDLKQGIAELLGPALPVQTPFHADKQHLLWWRDARGYDQPIYRAAQWPASTQANHRGPGRSHGNATGRVPTPARRADRGGAGRTRVHAAQDHVRLGRWRTRAGIFADPARSETPCAGHTLPSPNHATGQNRTGRIRREPEPALCRGTRRARVCRARPRRREFR